MMKYATDLSTLEQAMMVRVLIDGTAILLAWKDGKAYALADKCPHMGASLAKGTYANGIVTCRLHGAQIDVVSGEILEKAHILFVKMPTQKAAVYKTVVQEGKVFVEI